MLYNWTLHGKISKLSYQFVKFPESNMINIPEHIRSMNFTLLLVKVQINFNRETILIFEWYRICLLSPSCSHFQSKQKITIHHFFQTANNMIVKVFGWTLYWFLRVNCFNHFIFNYKWHYEAIQTCLVLHSSTSSRSPSLLCVINWS